MTPAMNNSQYDSPDTVLPLTTKSFVSESTSEYTSKCFFPLQDTQPKKRPSDSGQSSLDSFLKPKLSKC